MELKILEPGDTDLLCAVEPGLFDNPVDPVQAHAFLQDPLHHIVVALDADQAVAFASGTIVLHPDKPPSMFVNEVGTRESHQRRGFGTAVLQALMASARSMGCRGIWLGTEPDNAAALAFYRSLGGDEIVFVGFGWDGAFDED